MIEALPPSDLDDLVVANHILYDHGVVDGFGHVSRRDPRDPARYWMSRSMAPALVTTNDILPYDLDSNPLVDNPPPVYLERFIHGEIYRKHPSVVAVVHSHAASVIPFGVVKDVKLRAINHMAGFLNQAAPVFEIRDHAGDCSDLLIRDPQLGVALSEALGDSPVVLMRGHGATIVGTDLRQAVFRAIYAAENAALQSQAMQLGGAVTFLTEGEAESTSRMADATLHRAWELWVRNVREKQA